MSDWVDDPTFKNDDDGWVDDPSFNEQKASPLVSGVRNFLQGATAGFSDEAAGLVEGAGRAAGLEGLGGPMKDIAIGDDGPTLDWEIIKDAYKRARDKERSSLKKDQKDNPGVSTMAQLAGGVASPINKFLPGSMVGQGASFGGINALGSSDADNVKDLAIDTGQGLALGAAIGYGAEKASPLIQKGIDKVSSGAKDLSEKMAARALGAERGTIKKLGQDKVQDLGRYALDEGLLSSLGSTEDVIARNAAKKASGGKMMEKVYNSIDEVGEHSFNPLDAAAKVDEKIGGFYRSPINRGETNQLENTLESMLMRGDKNIPLKEAQVLKQELGKVANWKNTLSPTDKEKMAREAYGVVSSQIDEAVNAGMKKIGSDDLLATLKEGKALYGNAKGAETLLENKLAREQGNNLFGLTDSIAAAGAGGYGATTGDWSTAAGLMVAKKGLQKYGVQNTALGLDKISKGLMKSPQMAEVFQKSPNVFQSMVHQLEKKAGMFENSLPRAADQQNDGASNFDKKMDNQALLQKTQGTKYGQVLQNAAGKGEQSLAAAHYVLSNRDPDYRKLTNE